MLTNDDKYRSEEERRLRVAPPMEKGWQVQSGMVEQKMERQRHVKFA
jgi:hypothetical protein